MTGLATSLLLLITQLPATPIETRIVATSESPITLVGLPCGEEPKKLKAVATGEEQAPKFASAPFACEKDCAVGVRVKDGISSFTIATALVHDRGRVTSAVGPALVPSALQSCNGEKFVLAAMPRIAWPVTAGIVYVSEVTFENGTTWKADADQVQAAAFRRWIIQPKHGQ